MRIYKNNKDNQKINEVFNIITRIIVIVIILCNVVIAANPLVDNCVDKIMDKYPKMNMAKAYDKCDYTVNKYKSRVKDIKITNPNFDNMSNKEIRKIKGHNENLKDFSIPKIKLLVKFSRYEIKDILENNKDNLQHMLKVKEEFNENSLIKRKIPDIEKLTTEYLLAKQDYINAKKKYIDARKSFRNNKKKLQTCTEQCNELQKEIKKNAKDFLLHTADQIDAALRKSKAKVESNENLKQEEADSLVAKLNTSIDNIQNLRYEIEASITKEEVQNANNKMIEEWNKARPLIKISTGRIVNSRIAEFIARAQFLEERLNKILSNLELKGKDVSEIDDKIKEFSQKIFEAKTLYAETKLIYAEKKDDVSLKEANNKIISANNKIKEAHRILTQILKDLKKNKESAEELAKTDEELEVTESALEAIQNSNVYK